MDCDAISFQAYFKRYPHTSPVYQLVIRYNLPFEWRNLIPDAVIKYQRSFRSFCFEDLGLNRTTIVAFLKVLRFSVSFSEWYSREKQIKATWANQSPATRAGIILHRKSLIASRDKYQVLLQQQETFAKNRGFPSVDAYARFLIKSKGFEVVQSDPIIRMTKDSFIIKCLVCGSVFKSHFISNQRIVGCDVCTQNSTLYESELLVRIRSFYPHAKKFYFSSDSVIAGQGIDIFIPNDPLDDSKGGIGFEINGMFSHNSAISPCVRNGRGYFIEPKPRLYHSDKTTFALKQGIYLYHIWEHWPHHITDAIVDSKLGLNQCILNARNLTVSFDKELAIAHAKDFHIQSLNLIPSFTVSLLSKDSVVSSVSVLIKGDRASLLRYVVSDHVVIRGGFSRLLGYVKSSLISRGIHSLTTFSDRDISPDPNKSVYTRHGFLPLGDCGPTLFYYVHRTLRESSTKDVIMSVGSYSREVFQKHKLPSLFSRLGLEFKPGRTAHENLHDIGVYPVYNSGCFKYWLEF